MIAELNEAADLIDSAVDHIPCGDGVTRRGLREIADKLRTDEPFPVSHPRRQQPWEAESLILKAVKAAVGHAPVRHGSVIVVIPAECEFLPLRPFAIDNEIGARGWTEIAERWVLTPRPVSATEIEIAWEFYRGAVA